MPKKNTSLCKAQIGSYFKLRNREAKRLVLHGELCLSYQAERPRPRAALLDEEQVQTNLQSMAL